MPRYYQVSPRIWTDEKALAWDDDARLLALYLLTCPHRNLEGLYRLPLSYAVGDLSWSERRVRKALDRLIADSFASYDFDVEVVWVRNVLRYQAPKSERQVAGAIAALSEVPSTPLRDRLREVAETVAPELANAIANGSSNGSC